MRPSRIVYHFSKALDSIAQNPFVNLITVGVITVTFLIFGTFILIFSNLSSLLTIWEDEVRIEAYLKEGIGADLIDDARRAIMAMAEVSDVTFINKDDALKRFRENLGGMGNIIDDLGENPLPQSFDIILNEDSRGFDAVERVAARAKGIDGITDVVYGQEWAERFSTALAIVRLAGIVITALLLLATVFIVSNTIRLTVYAKKEELEIMKLMGATDRFIKIPFLIEGTLQGLAGAGLSLASLYIIYSSFIARVASSLETSLMSGAFRMDFLAPAALAYILLGGMALGLFGSFVSLGRFLKV